MKRIGMLSALMLTIGACTTTGDAPPEPSARYQSLAAPTPAGAKIRIDAASMGQNVSVKVGELFVVELVGTPTAGYMWAIKDPLPFLENAGQYGGPTSRAQLEPGFAGGNHWEGFAFRATEVGEGVLAFEKRRAWDDDEPPVDTFSVYLFATR